MPQREDDPEWNKYGALLPHPPPPLPYPLQHHHQHQPSTSSFSSQQTLHHILLNTQNSRCSPLSARLTHNAPPLVSSLCRFKFWQSKPEPEPQVTCPISLPHPAYAISLPHPPYAAAMRCPAQYQAQDNSFYLSQQACPRP
eukprot:1554597-Rhodomonas_salina.1